MSQLDLKKNYKAKEPKQTIINIKNILHDIGIFIKEEHFCTEEDLHTSHVRIANEEIGATNIVTNGKGLNISYSFASAYGEFMERLQNGVLLKNTHFAFKYKLNTIGECNLKKELTEADLILDFLYDPDEEYLDIEDVINEKYEFLSSLFGVKSLKSLKSLVLSDMQVKEAVCVPYFDYKKNGVTYLPQNLIYQTSTSNGMCAGNTPHEAIIQGICEVFERYALRQLYYSEVTPPTIPYEYFKGTKVYDLINRIKEAHGYKVEIKDCSLGKGLPVVGILIVNPNNYTYNFKLASDPWPVTAVERCLTELYQNHKGMLKTVGIDYYRNLNQTSEEISNEVLDYINFENITCYGTGHWPKSVFANEATYEFKGLDLSTGLSDKADISYLVDLVSDLGYDLYVRDVSFLGFPSFQVVIPGLSQTINSKEGLLFYNRFTKKWFDFLKVKELEDVDLEDLADAMSKIYPKLKESNKKINKFFLLNDDPELADLDVELFLVMAFYKVKRYNDSFRYLNKFLENARPENYLYYYCIRDFLKLKIDNSPHIKETLIRIYSNDLVTEVLEDMKYPRDIFDHHHLPACLGNKECEIKSHCRFLELVKLAKRIQNVQKGNRIDQSNLRSILHDRVIEEV